MPCLNYGDFIQSPRMPTLLVELQFGRLFPALALRDGEEPPFLMYPSQRRAGPDSSTFELANGIERQYHYCRRNARTSYLLYVIIVMMSCRQEELDPNLSGKMNHCATLTGIAGLNCEGQQKAMMHLVVDSSLA
jgi:hypothetical protein